MADNVLFYTEDSLLSDFLKKCGSWVGTNQITCLGEAPETVTAEPTDAEMLAFVQASQQC